MNFAYVSVLIALIGAPGFFGGRIDRRIIGGRDADIETKGYMVALYEKYCYFCCGSLIAPKIVLTACHCVHLLEVINLILRTGIKCHSDSKGDVSEAAEIILHPKCEPKTFNFDFSIVITVDTLDGPTIKLGRPVVNQRALIAGWGKTSVGGNPSNCLQQATVKILSNEQCIKKSNYSLGSIKESMFCAAAKGIDSCTGDSGAPIVDKYGYLIGIVSFGVGCANASYPGVYANATLIKDWCMSMLKIHC